MQLARIGEWLSIPRGQRPLDELAVTWSWGDLFKLGGAYLGWVLLAGVCMGLITGGNPNAFAFAHWLGLGIIYYLHTKYRFWPSGEVLGVTWQHFRTSWKTGVVWGIGIRMLSIGVSLLLMLLLSRVGYDTSGIQGNNPLIEIEFSLLWVILGLEISLVAPFIEEIFFRGFLYKMLRRHGLKVALIVSSLIFALFHGNLFVFLPTFVSGLAFALLYEREGRLAPVITAHAVTNLIAVLLSLVGFLTVR